MPVGGGRNRRAPAAERTAPGGGHRRRRPCCDPQDRQASARLRAMRAWGLEGDKDIIPDSIGGWRADDPGLRYPFGHQWPPMPPRLFRSRR
jgi:hypothetical protein